MKQELEVRRITRSECAPFILDIHYAKRWPSISYAYGLFVDGEIEGICTYGTPSSAPLRSGVAGHEMAKFVLELNRLCLCKNVKNHASILVSRSIKMLNKNAIIISFADTLRGHFGVVYQASNFSYHGLSAKRTDWKIKGMEHLHGQSIADEFRGMPNRSKLMAAKYGQDFYLAPRSRKHRYIKITGTKGFRAMVKNLIRYPQMPYPKSPKTERTG